MVNNLLEGQILELRSQFDKIKPITDKLGGFEYLMKLAEKEVKESKKVKN